MTELNCSTLPTENDDERRASILEMITHIEKEIELNGYAEVDENDTRNIELKIKTSRVMVAMEQTIQKLEIAFSLKWIIKENKDEVNEMYKNDMNMLTMEYAKIRKEKNLDVCRIEPMVINCISTAFEIGLGKFVDRHRDKVLMLIL